MLGYLFGINEKMASKYCKQMISEFDVLLSSPQLCNPMQFCSKECTDKNMLECFKQHHPTCGLIIDCTELFIETSKDELLQKATWSSYKHHNTLKVLVNISSTGHVCHVSPCYPGKISDGAITAKEKHSFSGLWDGAMIMADKGFVVNESIPEGVELNMPAKANAQAQFTDAQKAINASVASTRIHVERAIARAKKFKIIGDEISMDMLPYASKITRVCFYLTNFQGPLVINILNEGEMDDLQEVRLDDIEAASTAIIAAGNDDNPFLRPIEMLTEHLDGQQSQNEGYRKKLRIDVNVSCHPHEWSTEVMVD